MKDYLNLFDEYPGKTCFILDINNEIIFSSTERGVKPILDFYKEFGISKNPITIVDKIMGKGAIVLAILVGSTEIITPTISVDALHLANEYNLKCSYDNVVPYIINRDKNGRCPIESSVLQINSIEDGYQKIILAIKELMKKK